MPFFVCFVYFTLCAVPARAWVWHKRKKKVTSFLLLLTQLFIYFSLCVFVCRCARECARACGCVHEPTCVGAWVRVCVRASGRALRQDTLSFTFRYPSPSPLTLFTNLPSSTPLNFFNLPPAPHSHFFPSLDRFSIYSCGTN